MRQCVQNTLDFLPVWLVCVLNDGVVGDASKSTPAENFFVPVDCGRRERLKARVEGQAMRFMCLVYLDEEKMVAFAKDPLAIGAFEKEVVAYDQALNDKGVLVMASPLRRVREAVTIRVRGGRTLATDGPFAETKEQLGGFTLIDARDLNEAIAPR